MSAGRPSVIVPVLSSTSVWSLYAVSSASPPLISTPCSAPRPVPTMIAVGVARPNAHGHAMMSTETAATSASVKRVSCGASRNQPTNVAIAMQSTTGVKIPLITSASRAIGAFAPCASSTRRTICCRAVSRPTLVASNRKLPVALTVAPNTSSPRALSTGSDSPVSIDSFTAEVPDSTRPSTGIFSPGRTMTVSPGTTSSTRMSISVGPFGPSRTTRAVFACSPTRRRIASDVWPFARASSRRPTRMSAMMTLAASKYTGAPCGPGGEVPGTDMPGTDMLRIAVRPAVPANARGATVAATE